MNYYALGLTWHKGQKSSLVDNGGTSTKAKSSKNGFTNLPNIEQIPDKKLLFLILNDYKKISVWCCVSEICPLLLPYIYYHNSSIFIFWYEYDFGETTICKQKKLVIHFMKKPVAFCPLLCPKCMKTSPAWNDRQVNHNSRRDGESSNSRFES